LAETTNPRIAALLTAYLGSDQERLMNTIQWEGHHTPSMTKVTQTIFKFCILDKLLDAYEFPQAVQVPVVDRSQLPTIKGHLPERVSIYFLIHLLNKFTII
jgi:hypothetical protein